MVFPVPIFPRGRIHSMRIEKKNEISSKNQQTIQKILKLSTIADDINRLCKFQVNKFFFTLTNTLAWKTMVEALMFSKLYMYLIGGKLMFTIISKNSW